MTVAPHSAIAQETSATSRQSRSLAISQHKRDAEMLSLICADGITKWPKSAFTYGNVRSFVFISRSHLDDWEMTRIRLLYSYVPCIVSCRVQLVSSRIPLLVRKKHN